MLVREPVTQLTLTSDILRVQGLEGCISGNAPAGQVPPGGKDGPCARLARSKPAKVVFGPGTFLNEAIGQIQDQFSAESKARDAQAKRAATAARALARAQHKTPAQVRRYGEQAKQLVLAEFAKNVIALALKYGIRSAPQLNDPSFVSKIVFDDTKGPGVPKGRFAYIFPNKSSALIQVRFRPDLARAQRDRAIDLVRRAVAMPDWKLPNGKGTYVVTGAPVVVSDLTKSISHSLIVLLVAALVVMAITLSLVFRARLRLLPLVVAVAAAGLTFGALSLTGASLTMASIAVLPVLIGLAVDYAIQLQARVQEAQAAGDGIEAAVARTAARGAPTVATAAAATAAGFLVLALSPVPMVRGFGLLLVAGIALALGCALTLGVAALSAAARRGPGPPAMQALAPAWRGAGELLVANRAALAVRRRGAAVGRGALRVATAHPGRVVLVALVVAVAGWGLETQTRVESDLTKLVPQNGAIHDLQALQRSTDVGGEIDVVVSGPRVTDPAVVKWMTRLPGGGAQALRLLRQARLRQGRAVPRLLAARPLPGRAERDPPADRGPARRGAALLLAGRHHRRPADGDAGLRHPPHAARPPGGRHRRHARPPAPARRDRRRAGRAARAGGRGQRGRLLAVAAAGDAARRPRRGRARALRRLPGAGSARSCRCCRSPWPPAGRRSCSSPCGSR